MKAQGDSESLYCVMYNRFTPKFDRYRSMVGGEWKYKITVYVHAADLGQAKFKFLSTITPAQRRFVDVIGIAPVVGLHVEDNKGLVLSV